METDAFKNFRVCVYDLWTNEQERQKVNSYTEMMLFRNKWKSNYMVFIYFVIIFAIAPTINEVKPNYIYSIPDNYRKIFENTFYIQFYQWIFLLRVLLLYLKKIYSRT